MGAGSGVATNPAPGAAFASLAALTAVRKDPAVQTAGADLEFHYGPMGRRTIKRKKPRASGNLLPEGNWEAEYYIRDAQGEPMAIYRRTYTPVSGNTFTDALAQAETYAYGSTRLGAWNSARAYTRTLTSGGYTTTGGEQHFTSPAYTGTAPATTHFAAYPHATAFIRGEQTFEESNHLGNVLSTLSDRRIQYLSGGTVDHYRPNERSVADYSAFGTLLAQRHDASATARFGFNGQEKDDEVHNATGTSQDFGARMYDNRVGRFLSLDPLAARFSGFSPYSFAQNTPIQAIDEGGLKKYHYLRVLNEQTGKSTLLLINVETVYKNVQVGWANAPNSVWGRYPIYERVEDTEDQYVVHQTDRWFLQFKMKSVTVYGDESQSFKSYADASNCTDADFAWTDQDSKMAWQQGFLNVREETQTQGGFGGMFYVGRGGAWAGLEIQVAASADDIAFLEAQQAEALYMSTGENTGFMLVRPGATRPTILEEFIHHNQVKQYGIEFCQKNVAQLEIEAQDMLLQIGKQEGWSAEEMARISRARETWVGQQQQQR